MAKAADGSEWLAGLCDNWSQEMTAWQSLARAVPGVEDSMSRLADPSQMFVQLLNALGGDGGEGGFSAAEITRRWREVMSQAGVNPLSQGAAQAMPGFDVSSFMTPWLDAMLREASAPLDAPAFGPAREQQERWQRLLKAQRDNQQAQSRYQALLNRVLEQAFARFESKLAEHEAPGRQLTTVRALYDLWIDAAEEAYAGIALSPEFGVAYGDMVNAQMCLRVATQTEVEQVCRALGMPTRSEVTASHRKLHALQREVRALRAELAARAPAARPADGTAQVSPSKEAGGREAPPAAAPSRKTAPVRKTKAAGSVRPAARKAAAAKPRKPATTTARRRKGA